MLSTKLIFVKLGSSTKVVTKSSPFSGSARWKSSETGSIKLASAKLGGFVVGSVCWISTISVADWGVAVGWKLFFWLWGFPGEGLDIVSLIVKGINSNVPVFTGAETALWSSFFKVKPLVLIVVVLPTFEEFSKLAETGPVRTTASCIVKGTRWRLRLFWRLPPGWNRRII